MSAAPLHIASSRGVPGTAGAIVADAEGSRCVLTNYHVILGSGAVVGDQVWAIPPGLGNAVAHEPVCLGRAHAGRIGRVTLGDETYFVDCAVAAVADDPPFPAWLRAALADDTWPSETAAAVPGMHVFKCGATTGFTEGIVVDVAYPEHPFIEGRSWRAPGSSWSIRGIRS